ncbi:hypothetical protein RPSD_08490 [Ralstonia solanacearum]|nr:hypothetical protein RPSD_08490 [Ralstonia solanacearum]
MFEKRVLFAVKLGFTVDVTRAFGVETAVKGKKKDWVHGEQRPLEGQLKKEALAASAPRPSGGFASGTHNILVIVKQAGWLCTIYCVDSGFAYRETSSPLCTVGVRMDRIAAFGQVVREARLVKGLTQEALAEQAELHRNFVSLIERGQSKVALDSLFAIADALGMPASELLRLAEVLARRSVRR